MVLKSNFQSFLEWLLYTGFTVLGLIAYCHQSTTLIEHLSLILSKVFDSGIRTGTKIDLSPMQIENTSTSFVGAQWLSGRVLDSRPKGHGFKPHRRHCVVVLEQDTFILA